MAPTSHESGTEKLAGATAELMVAVELLRHGFGVSIPFGDTEGYDLISDSKSKLKRLQVKSSSVKSDHGTYRVAFSKGGKKRPYSREDTDFFVVVLSYPNGPAFYVIPVMEVKMRGSFWQAGDHPLPHKKWHLCKYENFRDRWDLLR